MQKHPEYKGNKPGSVQLVLIGGSRNAEDATRVDELRVLAKELNIDVGPQASHYESSILTSLRTLGSSNVHSERIIPGHAQVAVPSKHRPEHYGRRTFRYQYRGVHGISCSRVYDYLSLIVHVNVGCRSDTRHPRLRWSAQRHRRSFQRQTHWFVYILDLVVPAF